MENILKEQYVQLLFRFRKSGLDFPKISDINMSELFVMGSLPTDLLNVDKGISLSDIQSNIHVTKGAVSQIFNALEKKGYINREIDKTNRRRIIVTLTEEGNKVLENTKVQVEQKLEHIISRFGEKNMQQLIMLVNQLTDITDELKNEYITEVK